MSETPQEHGIANAEGVQSLTPVTREPDLFHEEARTYAEQLLEHPRNRCEIVVGDARRVLHDFPMGHFQCVVTSPPYWGLRDYGVGGQIGAETSVEAYIEDLVRLFREVRRTLADDGTLWLNIGDSYTSGGRTWRDADESEVASTIGECAWHVVHVDCARTGG